MAWPRFEPSISLVYVQSVTATSTCSIHSDDEYDDDDDNALLLLLLLLLLIIIIIIIIIIPDEDASVSKYHATNITHCKWTQV
jgi:hypothetical protein